MVSFLSLSLLYFLDIGFAKTALQFYIQDFFICNVMAIKECHSNTPPAYDVILILFQFLHCCIVMVEA